MSTIIQPVQGPATGQPSRLGELALALQEAFTVAVRLRAGRQVAADAVSFRAHIKQVLAGADQRARAVGYDGDTVKAAVYAFIALLDESVLNSANPIFSDWSRQPLQEEVFGEHMAGENFFRTLQDLLGRQDSEPLADLLEVYQLCLLIGFHGRYGSDTGGLHAVTSSIATKIARIRGGPPNVAELAPDWRLPAAEQLKRGRDVVARRLTVIAAAALGISVVLFLLYLLLLRSGVGELRSLVG
ncbi:MAG: DotU family type IV/VI secretion system protein [Gemmatimonadetes bacterium]|nr:DotU family type IV/VI secretion system protein [Gemmatimonadota bacterium]